MFTIPAGPKAQFDKLAGLVRSADLPGYLDALPSLVEFGGHPDQAEELRKLIHGVTTGDAREITVGTEGMISDALANYFGFAKVTVSAVPGQFHEHANLARCLATAADCCDRTDEHPKVGAAMAAAAPTAIDPALIAAIGQLALQLLAFLRDRRHPQPA